MRVESATYVKNHLGEIIDIALSEPVMIQRSGRDTVVMVSYQYYLEMMKIKQIFDKK